MLSSPWEGLVLCGLRTSIHLTEAETATKKWGGGGGAHVLNVKL